MRTHRSIALAGALVAAACLLLPAVAAAQAQPATVYRVTITNLTRAQPITPPVVATHTIGFHVFVPGEPASDALVVLAEEGMPGPLAEALEAIPQVHDVAVGGGPLPPGHSTTVDVEARGRAVFLSAVGMLAGTNDAFFGLDGFYLGGPPWSRHLEVPAYDAGSEANNELCEFVPGPPCNNLFARAPDGAEGAISIHNGIFGKGDLPADVWDWHNPVARIQIVRLAAFPAAP
jgi:hypothetical protein